MVLKPIITKNDAFRTNILVQVHSSYFCFPNHLEFCFPLSAFFFSTARQLVVIKAARHTSVS